MDKEETGQRARLVLILAIASVVLAFPAVAVVLAFAPSTWVIVLVAGLGLVAAGLGLAAALLSRKAREVIHAGQPGRVEIEAGGILGYVGLAVGTAAILTLLTVLTANSESSILLGLSQVVQTLLVVIAGSILVAALVYLVLGVIFKSRYALPFVLLSPAIVGLCLLVIYPMGYEIRLAFSNMSLSHFKNPTYALAQGWQNLKLVFTQPVLKDVRFFPLLGRTVLWTAIQVPFHVLGGLVLALLLNRPMKLRGLYRALLVIPWALPPIVAILAWRGEFHYEYGFLNIMLRDIGLQAVQWKSSPLANWIAMNIVNIWLGIPFMMVILLGGLQSVPAELYEAAEIDGASWWQQFRKITMPLLQPVMTPAIILGVIWTFNNFNVPFFINENELETSDILVTALFRAAFQYNRYGFAAMFALVIFLILLVFSVFYVRFTGVLQGVSEPSARKLRRQERAALRRSGEKGEANP